MEGGRGKRVCGGGPQLPSDVLMVRMWWTGCWEDQLCSAQRVSSTLSSVDPEQCGHVFASRGCVEDLSYYFMFAIYIHVLCCAVLCCAV
mgnify:FL=1